MAKRLSISLDVAVTDQAASRQYVLESIQGFLEKIDADADFRQHKLDQVRDADDPTLVVLAFGHQDSSRELERVPGLLLR